jgi:hypothetical protein
MEGREEMSISKSFWVICVSLPAKWLVYPQIKCLIKVSDVEFLDKRGERSVGANMDRHVPL